jgi:hypothetical protein
MDCKQIVRLQNIADRMKFDLRKLTKTRVVKCTLGGGITWFILLAVAM